MKARCRHDIKVEVLLELFRPLNKKQLKDKTKLKYGKLNKILDEFREKKLIQKLKIKDGFVYRTTPKGRKLVRIFKELTDHLEGDEVLPHVFSSYR